MANDELTVEERAAQAFNRKVSGTPYVLGRSTGEWPDERGMSKTEALLLSVQLVGAVMDAVLVVAREVDELKRRAG